MLTVDFYSSDINCAPAGVKTNKESKPLDKQELNRFLAESETRAFRSAFFAVKHEDDALDIVQDSMMKFVKGYANRPADEWPLLFHRILQNGIKDYFRRKKVRSRWMVMLDYVLPPRYGDDPEKADPLEAVADQRKLDGENQLSNEQCINKVEIILAKLPLRQQQAFLLRSWEGLSTRETAQAMGCSEGSVKTHYFRALEQLKNALRDVID